MLKNKSRYRETLWPRQVITHILCNHTCLTLEKVAEVFGQDHSNISHSRIAVDKRMSINRDFKAQYESLIKYLEL